MRYYSTKSPQQFVTAETAVLKGLPDDNGLFMPEKLEPLPVSFWNNLNNYSFQEIAFTLAKYFLSPEVPEVELKRIIEATLQFDAPLVRLKDDLFVLELFHGPTLAFKDFGARFMAQLLRYFLRNNSKLSTILVATSGDTGSAVASGFYEVEGVEVILLYPSGKVSDLQEKQLTTLGKNITALEVAGNFDDCQSLVKQAFLDVDLKSKYQLSSANSINIARLIPQSFYYANALKQLPSDAEAVFVVPSGNFGNLTAGLFAAQLGMPVKQFVAATNANAVVPDYLKSGIYTAKASVPTLSNAMDVGNPSNFERLRALYPGGNSELGKVLKAYSFSDEETISAMQEIHQQFNYVMDPHGAVAYLGWKNYTNQVGGGTGILLETAHPAKFIETVESSLGIQLELPQQLKDVATKKKQAVLMNKDYKSFKDYLLSR